MASAALRSSLVKVSRVSVSQCLIRLQHTQAYEQEDDKSDNRPSFRDRDNFFEEEKIRNSQKLNEIAESAKKLLSNGEPSIAVLEYLTSELPQVNIRSRARYDTRLVFGPIIDSLIDKASAESAEKDNLFTPVTNEEIIQKLSEVNVVAFSNFDKIITEYYLKEKHQEVLMTWVSYLEYATVEGIRMQPFKTRAIVHLSYVEDCLQKGTKPDEETIKALLQVQKLSDLKFLRGVLTETLGKESPRYKLIDETFDKLVLSKKNPNSIQYLENAIREAQGGNPWAVMRQYGYVKRISSASGVPLSEETQVAFMNSFNRIFQARKAMDIWNEMIKAGLKPSTNGWNALMETVSKFGPQGERLEKVETVFENIPEKNDETYAKLINIYASAKHYEKIENLVNESLLSKPLIAQSYIQYLAAARKLEKAEASVAKLEKNGILLTRTTFNALIGGSIRANKFGDAKKLLKKMEDQGLHPDVATYTMLIDLTFKDTRQKGNLVNDDVISEFLENMRKGGIEPNVFTMTTIIDGLGKDASHEETAMKLFQYLQENNLVSNVTYSAMISSSFGFGKVRQAELYFKDYVRAGYKPTIPLWNQMFEGFMRNKVALKSREYYELFRKTVPDSFPDANKFTLFFLLRAARNERDTTLANMVLEDIDTHGLTVSSRVIETIQDLSKLHDTSIPKSIQALL